MRDIVIKKIRGVACALRTWHMSYEKTILSPQLLSIEKTKLNASQSKHVDFYLCRKRYGPSRRSATIIDHSYDFMDFGPRNLLPLSIMVDFILCHRLQIQLRLNAPNKYIMTAIDLPSRSEDSKIKSRFTERNIQKGQKRLFTILVLSLSILQCI